MSKKNATFTLHNLPWNKILVIFNIPHRRQKHYCWNKTFATTVIFRLYISTSSPDIVYWSSPIFSTSEPGKFTPRECQMIQHVRLWSAKRAVMLSCIQANHAAILVWWRTDPSSRYQNFPIRKTRSAMDPHWPLQGCTSGPNFGMASAVLRQLSSRICFKVYPHLMSSKSCGLRNDPPRNDRKRPEL